MAKRKIKKGDTFSSKRVIGFLSIFIMVTSVIGFIFGGTLQLGSSGGVEYGEHSFIQSAETGIWRVEVDGEYYDTYYLPNQLESLSYDSQVTEVLNNVLLVHVSIDPPKAVPNPEDEAASHIGHLLFQNELSRFGVYAEPSLFHPPTNESVPGLQNVRVFSCADATPTEPVIYIHIENNTGARVDGDCIIIEGSTPQELYRLYDRLILSLIGVMK